MYSQEFIDYVRFKILYSHVYVPYVDNSSCSLIKIYFLMLYVHAEFDRAIKTQC